MKIHVVVVLLVTVLAATDGLRIRYPPLGCENCQKGERCVKDDTIQCVTTPCPKHKCVTIKPGKCPAPPTGYGICIAECTYDDQCPGNLKCCGNCPRRCTVPEFSCTPKCRYGYVCAPKYVICVAAPCPPQFECVNPRPKPGVCPNPVSLSIYYPSCLYDSQCPGTKKCCGGKCVEP